ncbi:CD1375 family protein [Paenibacillus ginsengarvi]|uniref:ASCH domain-containing protein n=1 Tax=Paenibacillus ginsengarvi TaxID=400777 RepID=A0A3B0CNA6_9BACL|nr:CD1375 family protein [Paenibacillus ginsengarvi]RKN85857.1 ASCH domain-containing protein [Paenibacillus ginsengarvi]
MNLDLDRIKETYAELIRRGEKTIEQVPTKIREDVQELLENNNA